MSYRVPFVLALAEGMGKAILGAMDSVAFVAGGTDRRIHYDRVICTRAGVDYGFMVHRLASGLALAASSAAPSGRWDAWILIPESQDWRVGPAALRLLRRVVLGPRNENGDGAPYLAGPWGLPELARRFPAFAEAKLKPTIDEIGTKGAFYCPHIFWGDPAPETVAETDYAPADLECTLDVEPDKAALFPAEAEVGELALEPEEISR